jgi:ABC-type multidrug transport system fused ATPase/permease subunit
MTDAVVTTTLRASHAEESVVGLRGAFWVIGRALAYIRPFGWRFGGKMAFNAVSILTVLYVPWPAKLLIDNVILAHPVTEATALRYPPYLQWAIRMLEGRPPEQVALAVLLVGLVTVAVFGLFDQGSSTKNSIGGSKGASETDATRTAMSGGQDTAGNSENDANVGGSLSSGLFGLLEYRWQLRLSQALNHYYRSQLFQRIARLPMITLEDRRTGDMIYRVLYDTPAITNLCYNLLLSPMALLTFAAILYVMHLSFGSAPEVFWAAVALIPASFLAALPFSGATRNRAARSRVAGATTTSTIEESMANALAVQSLGGWPREIARFETASASSFRQFRGVVLVGLGVTAATGFAGFVVQLAVYVFIAGHIIDGIYTVGDFAVLLFYYQWMAGSSLALSQMWIRMQGNVVGLRRVFAVLDLPVEDDGGEAVLAPIRTGVRVEGAELVFADGRQALAGVDFEARLGEITAIVGPTGAGKTSLAYLIPRFHRPTGGRVLIDGHDVADVSVRSLRSQITYVFQDMHLFSVSAADNIRYGRPDAPMADVIAAAKVAGAHDFIEALPEGYATNLGSRGAKLSVGQRQRIAIARGLITKSRILILDEPTSALDPETERHLVNALSEGAKDRAVIIIAHRLSTVAHANKVVFMSEGRVIEQGSPADLQRRPGSAYARFVQMQGGA